MRGSSLLAAGVLWFQLCAVLVVESRSIRYHQRNKQGASDCSQMQKSSGYLDIYVTVSSFSEEVSNGSLVSRQLEINWSGRIPQPEDTIALFDRNPESASLSDALTIANPADHPTGYLRSEVDLPYMHFNITTLDDEPCLGYWAAYLVHGKPISSACLQIRPFWMQENRKYLQHQKLSKIMIPGSHDSGCFSTFSRHTDMISKYKYAQDETIFNQLIYGIRYFDLRVGFYKNTEEKFFINHSLLKTDHSVKAILLQVRSFLEATQEIVILDFHLFPVGFKDTSVHLTLMELIYECLNPYLIPNELFYASATMAQLWAKNKRVLVSYNHLARRQDKHGVLWRGLLRAWGNKQRPEDLKTYFEKVFSMPVPRGFWASMAELTPNTRFIVSHPNTGLRMLADEINRNVTSWFRDEFWEKANIVATDFFLGNNIVDVAIQANRQKLCSMMKSLYMK